MAFVRNTLLEHGLDQERVLKKVDTNENVADILTKPLQRIKHFQFLSSFGIMGKKEYDDMVKSEEMAENLVMSAFSSLLFQKA